MADDDPIDPRVTKVIHDMCLYMGFGMVDFVKQRAKDYLNLLDDGGNDFLKRVVSHEDNHKEFLELLILVGFVDKGSALTTSVIEGRLWVAQILLKKFGDRQEYVDNQLDHMGRSPLLMAAGKAQVKIVRLLLDYGADAEAKILVGHSGALMMMPVRMMHLEYREEFPTRVDAVEKMFLQIPAIRRNSFGWPVESELASEIKSEVIGEEFFSMLVAMRGRVFRKPLVLVRVGDLNI